MAKRNKMTSTKQKQHPQLHLLPITYGGKLAYAFTNIFIFSKKLIGVAKLLPEVLLRRS